MGIWGAINTRDGYGVARIGEDGHITEVLYQQYDSEAQAALAARLLNEQEGRDDI